MNENSRRIFAKLTAMLAIQDAQMVANPKPYIKAAYDELYKAQECFEAIERALSPDIVFDVAVENDIRPTDIQGEAYIRCNAALEVIRKYTTQK